METLNDWRLDGVYIPEEVAFAIWRQLDVGRTATELIAHVRAHPETEAPIGAITEVVRWAAGLYDEHGTAD
jgi:hypothetical protein